MPKDKTYVRWFDQLSSADVSVVGGKNASLGEMIRALERKKIRVPDGYATTAEAYWKFLEANDLTEQLRVQLKGLKDGKKSLAHVGKSIRRLFLRADFPQEIAEAICTAYQDLCKHYETPRVDVAVRSSATAEDLPEASFAGQQESFLNVTGEAELLEACKKCYASLFTDRAISYRTEKDFDHMKVALSIGVQKMVRADKASAGVMFSIDPETGFPRVVVINAAWGLGENVVQGTVNPDEYTVFKPLLSKKRLTPIIEKTLGDKQHKMIYARGRSKATRNIATPQKQRRSFVLDDAEILQLARWACAIEEHYEKPMDIEWAKDGKTNELCIVQARPETVQSQKAAGALKTYRLKEKGKRLISGLSVGEAITAGKACVIKSARDISRFKDGAVLITEVTDPDWVPIMKRAAGIVTDYGGRTSHAAIVSRELGIPAIVGTGEATKILKNGQEITLSCAEGNEGHVYDGILEFAETAVNPAKVPPTRTRIMMNMASPACGLSLVAVAVRWYWLGPDRIHYQRRHQNSPYGSSPL